MTLITNKTNITKTTSFQITNSNNLIKITATIIITITITITIIPKTTIIIKAIIKKTPKEISTKTISKPIIKITIKPKGIKITPIKTNSKTLQPIMRTIPHTRLKNNT